MAPGITLTTETPVSATAPGQVAVAGGRPGPRRSRAHWTAPWRRSWFWLGLVVVLFCLPLFVGLGRTDLDNDEAIYSFAVDVMVRSGDWLTPKAAPHEDLAFLEKPPLKMWIVALPIHLGVMPHDEFGLRFWDALFGGFAFLYIFAIGRMIGGPLCGVVAVLTLFVHGPLLFNHGLRSNNMEAALFLSYSGGIYHFMKWRTAGAEPVAPGTRDQGQGTRRHIFAISLYFVLAFMTKFVAALFLPMLLILATLLYAADRQRLRRDWLVIVAASVLAIGLIAPWFLYEYRQFGAGVWAAMFGEHVVKRFTASLDPDHLKPWYFYFLAILGNLRSSLAVTLTVFAGFGLILFRSVRRRWPEGVLILLWFALPVALISLGTSKIYHYAYPFLPPLALAAGYVVSVVSPPVWRFVDRPLRRFDAALRTPAPGVDRFPVLSVVLVCLAAVAGAIALATYATGNLRVAISGIVLVRNSNALRPLLIALVALALAGRLGTAVRVVVPTALLVLVLPVGLYGGTLSLLPLERHPLRSLRDCLQPIADRVAARDGRGPGVWVEDEHLTHPFNYYLRHLGPWEVRDFASDATVYMHLFDNRRLRPVLLSNGRFNAFSHRVSGGDAELVDAASRKAGVDAATLAASSAATPTAFVRFQYEVLVLPGPYSVCKPAGGPQ